MKTFSKILPWALLVIVALLWWGCLKKTADNVVLKSPAVSGEFKTEKPEQTKTDTVKVPKYLPGKTVPVYVYNPVNEKILKENDSLRKVFRTSPSDSAKLAQYNKAIELHDFKVPFEDSVIAANISGQTRGSLLNLKLAYTRKTVAVKTHVKTYRVMAGARLETTPELDGVRYAGMLHYGAPNGTLYTLSLGDHRYIGLGVSRTLWSRTRQSK